MVDMNKEITCPAPGTPGVSLLALETVASLPQKGAEAPEGRTVLTRAP